MMAANVGHGRYSFGGGADLSSWDILETLVLGDRGEQIDGLYADQDEEEGERVNAQDLLPVVQARGGTQRVGCVDNPNISHCPTPHT